MVFTIINDNPYKWGIFYLLIQMILFVLMTIYVYQYDLRAVQIPAGLSILCFAIIFVLLTTQSQTQGSKNHSRR